MYDMGLSDGISIGTSNGMDMLSMNSTQIYMNVKLMVSVFIILDRKIYEDSDSYRSGFIDGYMKGLLSAKLESTDDKSEQIYGSVLGFIEGVTSRSIEDIIDEFGLLSDIFKRAFSASKQLGINYPSYFAYYDDYFDDNLDSEDISTKLLMINYNDEDHYALRITDEDSIKLSYNDLISSRATMNVLRHMMTITYNTGEINMDPEGRLHMILPYGWKETTLSDQDGLPINTSKDYYNLDTKSIFDNFKMLNLTEDVQLSTRYGMTRGFERRIIVNDLQRENKLEGLTDDMKFIVNGVKGNMENINNYMMGYREGFYLGQLKDIDNDHKIDPQEGCLHGIMMGYIDAIVDSNLLIPDADIHNADSHLKEFIDNIEDSMSDDYIKMYTKGYRSAYMDTIDRLNITSPMYDIEYVLNESCDYDTGYFSEDDIESIESTSTPTGKPRRGTPRDSRTSRQKGDNRSIRNRNRRSRRK